MSVPANPGSTFVGRLRTVRNWQQDGKLGHLLVSFTSQRHCTEQPDCNAILSCDTSFTPIWAASRRGESAYELDVAAKRALRQTNGRGLIAADATL